MSRVLPAPGTIFLYVQLDPLLDHFFGFIRSVVSFAANFAFQCDNLHKNASSFYKLTVFPLCPQPLVILIFAAGSLLSFSPQAGLNRRPPPYHGGALPAELYGLVAFFIIHLFLKKCQKLSVFI